MFWTVFPPLSLGLSHIAPPQISPVDAASIYLCILFQPPLYPSRGETVHLDDTPDSWPPPIVCACLPCHPSQRSSLREPVTGFPCPFAPLCRPRPDPRSLLAPWFSCTGFPSYLCLSPSTSPPPPPFRPRPPYQSSARPSCGVVLFVPRPL